MNRAYRRRNRRTSRRCATEIQVFERPEWAAGNVTVELPVRLAEAVEGVTAEVEQLAGQAGVLIMQAVMAAEVERLAGPRGKHERERPLTPLGQSAGLRGARGAEGSAGSAADAKNLLLATVAWLEEINPSAAWSLREGLEETLTLHRLNVPEALRRSLRSTNPIESALRVVRPATERVKRWRKGDMRLRWSAAGLLAAENRFRRVRGYKSMAVLLGNVDAYDPRPAGKTEAA